MKTIGIVGSGQLGWMMILEGRKLGLKFNVLGKAPGDPASRIADRYFSSGESEEFLKESDFVTYEFEHVDRNVLEQAEKEEKLAPPLLAVDLKMDRSREKDYLHSVGVPNARYRVAENPDEAFSIASDFEKAVIKQCFEGYDGKGQAVVSKGQFLTNSGINGKCVVEEFIDYDFEASIICYRDRHGDIGFYTPSLNYNSHGMLVYNECPVHDYGMSSIATTLLTSLNYVGVMGIEFFIKDGKPLVNEISPRVHNSGHHTLMGSSISQFEQHIRIMADLPVSKPELYAPSGIVNLVGSVKDQLVEKILQMGNTTAYIYGKSERRRRKLGHINVVAPTFEELHKKIAEIKEMLYGNNLDSEFMP